MSSLAADPRRTYPQFQPTARPWCTSTTSFASSDAATGRCAHSTASRCRWPAGRSPRSWGRRARASRRCCSSPRGWTGRRRAACASASIELGELNERALARLRRERLGFVFQSFNLLGALTAEQNVALPARLAGKRLPRSVVRDVLHRVGLDERRGHRPAQLSGGQQQRVAIARALVGEPSVVFADEPTGALDTRAGRAVLALLRETIDESGATLVMVTHDPSAAAWADRVVFMADGRLAGELHAPTAEQVAERLTGLGA